MFYAFFALDWNGEVELRGLQPGAYKVVDYVNQKDFGTVQGPTAKVKANFGDYLLLEAIPSDTTGVSNN
jgi:alpha-galactosidase